MNKFTFLLLLLLSSNQLISQTTTTNPIKCFSESQITEVFKGLKQGEYLKTRLLETEKTLESANNVYNQSLAVISDQKETIGLQKSAIEKSKNLIDANNALCEGEKNILNIQKEGLENQIKINDLKFKKEKRNSLWKGIKIGGFSVAVLGVTALLILK